jgi:hypothetical protein
VLSGFQSPLRANFKSELLTEDVKEARRTVEGFNEELRSSGQTRTSSSPSASTSRSVVEDEGHATKANETL